MLARIVRESLTRRRRRKLLSAAAVALGIAVATALGTIALEVGDKISRELRSYGANLSVTPVAEGLAISVGGMDYRPQTASGAFLAEADLVKLKKIFWRNNVLAIAPYLYVPVKVQGHSGILIGSWIDKEVRVDGAEIFRTGVKELHPAWKVQGEWPEDSELASCLVGRRLALKAGITPGEKIEVKVAAGFNRGIPGAISKGGASTQLLVRGILDAGGPEDDQVMVPLAAAQTLAGLEGRVRRVEVSVLTKPEDSFARSDPSKLSPEEFERWYCSPYVKSIAYQISRAIPGAEAKPVYQVAESEGRVLNRVGILMALLAGAALAAAALAVASMMLASVLERRVEIGLFKSLGATEFHVAAIFLLEALVVALVGAILGYFLGSLLARGLALTVFGSPVGLHWVIFPAAVALALVVTLLGCAIPIVRGLKISPARVLRD